MLSRASDIPADKASSQRGGGTSGTWDYPSAAGKVDGGLSCGVSYSRNFPLFNSRSAQSY